MSDRTKIELVRCDLELYPRLRGALIVRSGRAAVAVAARNRCRLCSAELPELPEDRRRATRPAGRYQRQCADRAACEARSLAHLRGRLAGARRLGVGRTRSRPAEPADRPRWNEELRTTWTPEPQEEPPCR